MNLSHLLLELSLLALLGVLYYFYQRRRILKTEEQKAPILMGGLLQACLYERDHFPSGEIDAVIEALDDFLHNKSPNPPITLLKIFSHSEQCPSDLSEVIEATLHELGE